MSKHLHSPGMPQPPDDDEELLLAGRRGGTGADIPLLPRYERHPSAGAGQAGPSPHRVLQATRRRSRACSVIWCLWAFFVPLGLSLALLGCYFGRSTLDRVRGWQAWEGVPQDVKDWLESVAPLHAEQQHTAGSGGAFPTDIGYAGPTPTGVEPALMATAPALPLYSAVAPLVPPKTQTSSGFSIMQHWGNLSPYFSVSSHGLPEGSSVIPEQCELEELHWLQRHGARYPTQGAGGDGLADRLKNAGDWTARGELKFLNDWKYKLGSEILTPYGRGQLYNLGVAARLKYGFLLDKMKGRKPVFRTESQDRMLKSAQNFAAGFFGIPAEEQYNLEVMIEWPGFNCTLAPYYGCANDHGTASETWEKMKQWDEIFLKDAVKRLNKDMSGYDLSTRDVKDFMDMCAYETVALGYSAFCNLFTQKEWKGYEYRNDLYWWGAASFGYPYARAEGKGWLQELLSRLTHTRLTTFDSTTNSSFHNDVQFPLNDKIYVDFTHDTVFALLLPTLNLTTFAESGEPPADKIPKHRSFVSSRICPFATNMQLQVLTCSGSKQVRLILNDAPVPLTGIRGCPEDDEGLCPFDAFVSSMQDLVDETDFGAICGTRDSGASPTRPRRRGPDSVDDLIW